MTSRTSALLFAICLSGVLLSGDVDVSAVEATSDDHTETKQLIDEVNRSSDPSKTGPYALTAKLRFNPGTKGEQTGELRLYRDLQRVRVDLELRNYHETRIQDGTKLFIARSGPPAPGTMILLEIYKFWRINVPSQAKFSAISNKKRGAIQAKCFSIKDTHYHIETRYCVDSQSKMLLESSTPYETVKLQGPFSIGEGYVPTSIVMNENEPNRHIEIVDIATTKMKPQDDTFAPPPNAREFETCDNIEGGDFVRKVEPVYPRSAGNIGPATLFFHGTIEKDGSFTHVYVFSPQGAAFEQAGREAAAQWKFTPGMCAGHTVAAESQTVIVLSRQ